MKRENIKLGGYYRIKDCVDSYGHYYGYAYVIGVYKKGDVNNPLKIDCVECSHVLSKDDRVGLVRYFKPSRLIEDNI